MAWASVHDHAVGIVGSYDTGVTLRQLFYRLVADLTLPNTKPYYKRLSAYTARWRREGTFPDLLDQTSRIEQPLHFAGPDDALEWLRDRYRLDRTVGQPWQVWLGVEKAGMSAQLYDWLSDPYGIPHVALGGGASQTLVDQVARRIQRDDRPAAFIYAGDHDPTGWDIERDFVARVGVFDKTIRVALDPDQVERYELPFDPDPEVTAKLARDPRAKRFVERFGSLVQYELDALPPDTLRDLYRSAVERFWDDDAYEAVLDQERAESP